MAKINYKKIPRKLIASGAIIALLGVGGATLTVNFIAEHEGYVEGVYLDPAGIPTQCFGDIYHIAEGKKRGVDFNYCEKLLNDEVLSHAKAVIRCVPAIVEQPDGVKAAMLSMAYNIGSGAFCKSKTAAFANAGDWNAACRQIPKGFTTAKGKKLPGLVNRRKDESRLCLEALEQENLPEEIRQ